MGKDFADSQGDTEGEFFFLGQVTCERTHSQLIMQA